MMNRLELKQVVKQYADKTAVNGVTLNVKEGGDLRIARSQWCR